MKASKALVEVGAKEAFQVCRSVFEAENRTGAVAPYKTGFLTGLKAVWETTMSYRFASW